MSTKTSVESMAAFLCASGYAAWRGVLTGRPGFPGLFEWMKNPKPGDLVMETSSLCRTEDIYRVGTLLRIEQGWFHPDEQWERIKQEWEGEPRPTDVFWIIETLDGHEYRWSNCSFIRLPRTSRELLDIGSTPRLPASDDPAPPARR
jgi:hypothetical protein